MNREQDHLIEAIQSSGFKACVVVSGGGSGAVSALLTHPGASRFVFEAQVPYSPEAMFDYLGETLEPACSREAAATMAQRAFARAETFSTTSGGTLPVLGIACTAALQTNRPRKGKDRAFVCIKSRQQEQVCEISLSAGGRAGQEEELSHAVLVLIAEYVGVDTP